MIFDGADSLSAYVPTASQREGSGGISSQECHKAQCEHRVLERGSEVLPKGNVRSGVVGGEKQREHVEEASEAGPTDENAGGETEADGEFSVGCEEGPEGSVRQYQGAQNRYHEWIGAILQEAVDPVLEASAESEARTEDLVFGEDEKQRTDADSENGEGASVAVVRRHRGRVNQELRFAELWSCGGITLVCE